MRLPSPAQQRSLESEIAAAQQALAKSETAVSYLRSRNLTRETAERFRLGYDPRDNRLTIPYLHPGGAWHLKRRCIRDHDHKADDCPKYSYEAGVEMHLFNAQALLTADSVVVTEGELDAIACEQAGVAAVGYPGASTWARMRHWPLCFDSAEEVVVIADGDEPGTKAAGVVAKSLRQSVSADVRVVQMPPGEDASSFLQSRGDGEFLALIDWL